jgi:hypothetical protein
LLRCLRIRIYIYLRESITYIKSSGLCANFPHKKLDGEGAVNYTFMDINMWIMAV